MIVRYQPQTIRFMKDASENSAYYTELADRIHSCLPENAQVCDAGCGLGYLSLALSGYCRHVSAVDIAPQALRVLRDNMLRGSFGNISVIEGDIRACPPDKPYDAMVFCFFGHTNEALQIAKAQCRGRVILIKRNGRAHRFTLGHKPLERCTLAQTCSELRALGIRFTSETFALEMGQPFHTLKDAVAFFRIYSRDDEPWKIAEGDIISRLICRPSEEFPYYLPSLKQIGMIVLDAGDIPEISIKRGE